MMSAPIYAPPPPTMEANAGPQFAPPPQEWPQFGSPQGPQFAPPAPRLAQQGPPAPKFRAQIADEPSRPTRPAVASVRPALNMPSPEQLGVACGKPADSGFPDWGILHQRLDRLGVSSTHLEKLPQGGCRFTCLLPTGRQDQFHRVEAQAATEAEAMRLVVVAAEQWAGDK